MAKNRVRMSANHSPAHTAIKKDVQRIIHHLLNTIQSTFHKRDVIESMELENDHPGFSAIALHYYGR